MASEHEDRNELRITILKMICIAVFVLYAVQLFRMQVVSGDIYRSRAQNIARRTTVIPSQRGEIYARDFGQPLVSNVDSFAVLITPAEVPQGKMTQTIRTLSQILSLPEEDIENKVPPSIYHLYQPVEVAVNIPYSSIAILAEMVNGLPGVSWQSKPLRNYAAIGSLSHIIGYVGDITRDELTMMYNQGYKQGDVIGKGGIERQYDGLLRGTEGSEVRTVDVRGRRVAGDNTRQAPVMGKNLVLTIDKDIQVLAEKALGRRIGSVVVLRPTTGEVLAMVSYPWYDSNIFTQSNRDAEFEALRNDPNKPFLNRAIQSSYPPASTFKIIMSSGIYRENSFPPEQTIDCQGEMVYGNRVWHCHIHRPGHGRLNLHQAMAQSCDIYYWVVGRDYLGVEDIYAYAREYGLNAKTGIDIPGEIAGFIPTPQWKERSRHERWLAGDTMLMSIGQGDTLVTPIQMANIAAMVVNDGVIYQPHLLKEVRDPQTGAVEQSVQPAVLQNSDIPQEVFARIREDMRGVISEGTARFPLNIKTVEIAGKTGTGEVAGYQNQWHSWLTSFAPYVTDKPEERVVVAVIVEAVNPWEWWAPYCTAIIYQGIYGRQTYEDAVRALGIQNNQPVYGRRE